VYPALAVVEELGPSAEVLWVGGEGGMEASLVKRAGISFKAIPAAGVHGVGLKTMPKNSVALLKGYFAARTVVRRFAPDVMFFTGGYVGVPTALAGRNVPKVAYVPDIEPALALKVIGWMVDVTLVTAEESRKYYSENRRIIVSGYPTRSGIRNVDKSTGKRILHLHGEKPVVLIFGGSRGARSINFAVWKNLEHLLGKTQVLHITGELDWDRVKEVRSSLSNDLASDYHPFSYLHDEMGAALASADLVVSRAGAATLGEYPIFGLPAILIPYPHAWKYQKVNADHLCSLGAATQIRDEELDDQLLPTIFGLLEDRNRLRSMGEAARLSAVPSASRLIANEIERVAGLKERTYG
jgi:UDP-N-acetylglucosamine--N-acetylmuramyl-(pentapeptide) pyrophosphoryl-undecaprenol N-acetylglucosamine transferase